MYILESLCIRMSDIEWKNMTSGHYTFKMKVLCNTKVKRKQMHVEHVE